MSAPVTQLDYAPPRRRWPWGKYSVVVLLLAAAGAAVSYRQPLWRRAQVVHWQRQCMTYESSAGVVPHESDPARAAALVAAGGDYVRSADGTGAVLRPRCWRSLNGLLNLPVVVQNRKVLAGSIPDLACVFLHERRSGGGTTRLVHVQAQGQLNVFSLAAELAADYAAIVPGGFVWDPTHAAVRQPLNYSGRFVPAVVGYGTADPADPSHFTIPYASDIGNGTIDGWLTDDGRVTFEVRDGPGRRR